MNVFIGRIAAAIASAVITWLMSLLDFLPVTAEQTASAVEWLTEGLTGFGAFLMLIMYGIIHKMINSKLNPVDAAAKPEAEEIRAPTRRY